MLTALAVIGRGFAALGQYWRTECRTKEEVLFGRIGIFEFFYRGLVRYSKGLVRAVPKSIMARFRISEESLSRAKV